MNSLTNKLIIYDSNCKVCSSLKGWILQLTSIPAHQIVAYKELSGELISKVDAALFKNVMALIDTKEGKTLYGAEGVAYIFGSQFWWFRVLFKVRLFQYLFTILYKTIAYNRYIIATPVTSITCDCLPDNVVKYRLSYIGITTGISIILTMLFGISLKSLFVGMDTAHSALEMLLMAGSGWIIQIVIYTIINRKNVLEYLGHLGSIMVAGLLILVPWMLIHFITQWNSSWFPLISVVLSSTYMLYLHIHRIRYLQQSKWWSATWFLSLQFAALFWVYFFHLKN